MVTEYTGDKRVILKYTGDKHGLLLRCLGPRHAKQVLVPSAARLSPGEGRPAAEATCTKGGARAEVGSRRRGVMY